MRRTIAVPIAVAALLVATAAVVWASDRSGAPDAGVPTPSRAPAPSTLTGATVLSAASLGDLFRAMAPRLRHSSGGSDGLAFQIRQGAPADVYVSADERLPRELHAEGLVEAPVVIARNRLAVVVPRANPARLRSVRDLARPGVRLVLADATVPAGGYSRTVLRRLGLDAALANVVSEEPDVRGVATKVALGEADAGIVYRTDVRAIRDRVIVLPVPARVMPRIAYSAAVTTGARDPATARAFIAYLRGADGRRWLRAYGFTPAP